jgi:hypothetical protein
MIWEYEMCLELLPPERLVVYVGAKDAAAYESLREHLGTRGHKMPPFGARGFVRFEPDGTSSIHKAFQREWLTD